ncbi:YkyB-like protein [Lentibacillus persicus]|uniref:YkyB-like protein n=1 Tax=Lentibacillus persicus TaxID=640948 RepID=A0A1I1VTU2_9BACI|nr:YkyB family protein [Lentibacillus persicus]SFD83970.1 YkyB-like protein [Lentibacillus persicus]
MAEKEPIPLEDLGKALFTINRHAKTAPDPKHLYYLKKESIKRLLQEKRAEKIGLHYSDNPKFSNQHSTLLVKVDKYFFHIPPEKGDFKDFKHLGKLDQNYRNPSTKMSLSQAKKIVYRYIDWQPAAKDPQRNPGKKKYRSSYFTPSSLGKMEWPPTKFKRKSH